MSEQRSRVDAFVGRATTWKAEIRKLRSILLDCGLEEDLKWGKPCYMVGGKNIAVIQPFKRHCALMFFKGALLEDPQGLLHSQGENTQSALRLEFTGEDQIDDSVLRSFVTQAIAVENAGLRVESRAKRPLELPGELACRLDQDDDLAQAFKALTAGRQRGYILHFTAAKQAKTRAARIEKCRPGILAGKGLNDR